MIERWVLDHDAKPVAKMLRRHARRNQSPQCKMVDQSWQGLGLRRGRDSKARCHTDYACVRQPNIIFTPIIRNALFGMALHLR